MSSWQMTHNQWYMVSNVRSLCEEGEYERDQLWKVAKDSYHSSSAHHLRKLFLLNRLLLPRANQLHWLFNFQIHASTPQIFLIVITWTQWVFYKTKIPGNLSPKAISLVFSAPFCHGQTEQTGTSDRPPPGGHDTYYLDCRLIFCHFFMIIIL